LGRAEDVIQGVCPLDNIEPGEEWIKVPIDFRSSFQVIITLDRESGRANQVAVESEVQALVSENSTEGDNIVYTDGSVVRHKRSAWAFTAQCQGKTVWEESGAFAVTTSSMTMEVMAVTKALVWLELMNATHVCVLSDSMSMLRKVQTGCVRREWLESVSRSELQSVTFIFVPGHSRVRGNERADKLASLSIIAEGRAMDRADVLNAV